MKSKSYYFPALAIRSWAGLNTGVATVKKCIEEHKELQVYRTPKGANHAGHNITGPCFDGETFTIIRMRVYEDGTCTLTDYCNHFNEGVVNVDISNLQWKITRARWNRLW